MLGRQRFPRQQQFCARHRDRLRAAQDLARPLEGAGDDVAHRDVDLARGRLRGLRAGLAGVPCRNGLRRRRIGALADRLDPCRSG